MKKLMVAVAVAGAVAFGASAGTFLDSPNADSRKADFVSYATGGDEVYGGEPSDMTYPVDNEFFATDDTTVKYKSEDGVLVVSFTDTTTEHAFVLRTDAVLEEALIVGGGGSGGWTIGGGGGGGGVVELKDAINLAAGAQMAVKVGAGGVCPKSGSGIGGNNASWVVGQNGEYSVLAFGGNEYKAYGGGAGATWDKPSTGRGEVIKPDVRSGGFVGSSGGAAENSACDVDAAVGQGNKGGSSFGKGPGGGGGANNVGGAGSSAQAGRGGEGKVSSISGTAQVYGSGGGGGAGSGICTLNGQGGTNAGQGSSVGSNVAGGNAVNGFGGGGGGGSYSSNAGTAGGDGGSGTVILKFRTSSEKPVAALDVAPQGAVSAVISITKLAPGKNAESCDVKLAYWREGIDSEAAPELVATGVTEENWSTTVGGILSGVAYHFRVVLTNDHSLEKVLDLVTAPFAVGQAKASDPEFTYSGEFEKLLLDGCYAIRLLSSGTLTPIGDIAVDEILLVGGGGAGGWTVGGGGGGGGVIDVKEHSVLEAGAGYEVGVGLGGTVGGNTWVNGGNGGDTTFLEMTAYGGGGGNAWDVGGSAPSGGCGGGDASGTQRQDSTAPGKGTEGQGCDGGARDGDCPGGGGGAAKPGEDGGNGKAGDGGEGYESDITGESEVYGSGGGGGAGLNCGKAGVGGTNAGDGSAKDSGAVGGSGTKGFGGGGGGGSYNGATAGGNGGSGVVILRTCRAAGHSLVYRELNGRTLTAAFSRSGVADAEDIYMGVGSTYGGWDATAWDSFAKVGAFEQDALQANVVVDELPAGAEYVIFRFGADGAWSEALVLDELVTAAESPSIEFISATSDTKNGNMLKATISVYSFGGTCESCDLHVAWGLRENELIWAKTFHLTELDEVTYELAGLLPRCTYFVKAWAENPDGGISDPAVKIVGCNTDDFGELSEDDVVLSRTIDAVTRDGELAVLEGSFVKGGAVDGAALVVEVSKLPNFEEFETFTATGDFTNGGTWRCEMARDDANHEGFIAPDTTYYFRVKVVAADGLHDIVEGGSFKTLGEAGLVGAKGVRDNRVLTISGNVSLGAGTTTLTCYLGDGTSDISKMDVLGVRTYNYDATDTSFAFTTNLVYEHHYYWALTVSNSSAGQDWSGKQSGDLGVCGDSTTYTWKGGAGDWRDAEMWTASRDDGRGFPVYGSTAKFVTGEEPIVVSITNAERLTVLTLSAGATPVTFKGLSDDAAIFRVDSSNQAFDGDVTFDAVDFSDNQAHVNGKLTLANGARMDMSEGNFNIGANSTVEVASGSYLKTRFVMGGNGCKLIVDNAEVDPADSYWTYNGNTDFTLVLKGESPIYRRGGTYDMTSGGDCTIIFEIPAEGYKTVPFVGGISGCSRAVSVQMPKESPIHKATGKIRVQLTTGDCTASQVAFGAGDNENSEFYYDANKLWYFHARPAGLMFLLR